MGAAVDGVDVVGERVDAFGEAVVVLQRDLNAGVADAPLDIEGLAVQRHAAEVQVAHERDDAALEIEGPLAFVALPGPLVDERDAQALRQVGHLTEALSQRVEAVVDCSEDRPIGHEADRGAVRFGGVALALDGLERHTLHVLLDVQTTVLAHLDAHPFAEGVDHAGADAVQTRGDLVTAAAELAAGVQHGHHHFQGRLLQLRLEVDRDATAIVRDRDRAVGVDNHLDPIAVTGQRLVDGIVDELVDHVVQAVYVGVADVHARPATNSFEALEDLDVGARVGAAGLQVESFGLVDLSVFFV